MVAVAEHHAYVAVHESVLPVGIACQGLVAVAFEIGLVHHIETVEIHHGVHLGMARVVAGADRVEVGLFHEPYVSEHGLVVDVAAVEGVGVVYVGALEEYALAVDRLVMVIG